MNNVSELHPGENSKPPTDTSKVPTRPPTERERRDVCIKFLSSLIQNTMLSEEQAATFPELKFCMEKLSAVGRECLKEVL